MKNTEERVIELQKDFTGKSTTKNWLKSHSWLAAAECLEGGRPQKSVIITKHGQPSEVCGESL